MHKVFSTAKQLAVKTNYLEKNMNKLLKSTLFASALLVGASAFANTSNALTNTYSAQPNDSICIGVSAVVVFIEYCFDI